MYRFISSIFISVLVSTPLTVFCQSVSVTEITPESPAHLDFGEPINISFEYDIGASEGVQIFVRPITDGERTPNYSASGSQVYRGRGAETAHFTVEEGKVTVDQLRFRIVIRKTDETIFEFFVPVEFTFSSTSFQQPSTPHPNLHPQVNYPNDNIDISNYIDVPVENNTDDQAPVYVPDSIEIKRRIIREDGTIHIYYTNGYERVFESGAAASEYFVTPEGDTSYMHRTPLIDVQEASPPGFIGVDSEASQEWISNLNSWLKYHNARLMKEISSILDSEESLQSYKKYEDENSSSIYEEIDIRYRFLSKLVESDI